MNSIRGRSTITGRGLTTLWQRLSEERTNMKNTPSVSRGTDPSKSIRAPSHKEKDKSPVTPLDLSPERLTERASTATKVLNTFLERDDRTHYLRHWGINE